MGMKSEEAVVFRDVYEVDKRLAELDLNRKTLLDVRAIAMNAAADATPFHPANAPGTFAYHHGTWGLRNHFVLPGKKWRNDRPNGVEAIVHDESKIAIVFANVDVACNDDIKPKPRSRKGTGSERVCSGNLFKYLPEYVPVQTGQVTYYLMVSNTGAAELTRPVVRNGTFVAWPERIYLSDGSDFDNTTFMLDDNDIADDFDPQVVRK
jgi:hypothetical protein